MAYGQSSGTTAFVPFGSDLVLGALERCQIYEPQQKHMTGARRSANLLLTSKWSNRGLNLWRVDQEPTVTPMILGVAEYLLTSDVVAVYDTYRRQYNMGAVASFASNFSTVLNQTTVTIIDPAATVSVGGYISLPVYVAVGGLILYGFYQVQSAGAGSFTINAASQATATINNGGSVPTFTTAIGSANVTVGLTAHGFLPGQPFNVAVQTIIGGVTLYGSYTIQSVTNANQFVIAASNNANANAGPTAMNGGQPQIATSNVGQAAYSDIYMGPISRQDYAGLANKNAAGPPSSYWVNRQIIPVVTVYPIPDASGPYELHSYCMRQIQDASLSGGETLNLPQRMWYPFELDLAADLASKFVPSRFADLSTMAAQAWDDASDQDVEHVSTFILPMLPNGL